MYYNANNSGGTKRSDVRGNFWTYCTSIGFCCLSPLPLTETHFSSVFHKLGVSQALGLLFCYRPTSSFWVTSSICMALIIISVLLTQNVYFRPNFFPVVETLSSQGQLDISTSIPPKIISIFNFVSLLFLSQMSGNNPKVISSTHNYL